MQSLKVVIDFLGASAKRFVANNTYRQRICDGFLVDLAYGSQVTWQKNGEILHSRISVV